LLDGPADGLSGRLWRPLLLHTHLSSLVGRDQFATS
jgi:hypothetical protein